MPATARRSKSEAYEKGIREGKAMAQRSRGEKPAEEEEMDGGMYGKKPMDAECGCGKKKKKGRKCDGDCGYKRKRSDSLTAQEYLTACELGIQDRSSTYIRARLDVAEARNDLKCGKGAISEGEKCTKGPATKVEPKKPNMVSRYKTAKRTWERRYGKPKQKTTKQKLKAAAVAGLAVGTGIGVAALAHRRSSPLNVKRVPDISNIKVPKPGKIGLSGSALQKAADRGRMNQLESLARGNNPALEAQLGAAKMRSSEARRELKAMRGQFQQLRSELGVWGPNRIKPFKRKRRDSIWAEGFES